MRPPARRALRKARSRLRAAPAGAGSDGSAAIESILVLPVLMLLVAAAFQFALWALAAHAVSLAVSASGAVARSANGTTRGAETTAADDLSQLAGGLVLDPSVTLVSGSDSEVTVVVTGQVPSLIPGVKLSVSARSTGLTQQFRGSG